MSSTNKNRLEIGAFSCPMPCYHIELNLEPEDPMLCHMARGVAIALGTLMTMSQVEFRVQSLY